MSMHDEKNTYKIFLVKMIHIIISIMLFYLFWLLFRYGELAKGGYGFRYNYYVTMLYAVLTYGFSRTYNSYLLDYSRIRNLVFNQILVQLFSLVLTYIITGIAWRTFHPPWVFIPLFALQLIVDITWSWLATWFYFRLIPRRKTLLIYRNALDKKRFGSIEGKPTERMFQITDELQYDGTFSKLKNRLEGYDAFFVTGVNSRCRNGILKYCKEKNIPCFFLPHVGDEIMREAKHIAAFDSPVMYVNRTVLDPEYAFIKRAFDIVSSGLALVILSPIFLIVSLCIHFYDGGPVFYKQTRLTKNGKEFEIINVFEEDFKTVLCNKATNIAV